MCIIMHVYVYVCIIMHVYVYVCIGMFVDQAAQISQNAATKCLHRKFSYHSRTMSNKPLSSGSENRLWSVDQRLRKNGYR